MRLPRSQSDSSATRRMLLPSNKMMFVLIVKLLLVVQWSGVSGSTPEGRVQNFVATENSNLEVLKELGVDIQSEGRTHKQTKNF